MIDIFQPSIFFLVVMVGPRSVIKRSSVSLQLSSVPKFNSNFKQTQGVQGWETGSRPARLALRSPIMTQQDKRAGYSLIVIGCLNEALIIFIAY
jgi:hypothetical protein